VGCGPSTSSRVPARPPLEVVTGLYPLAQAVMFIGEGRAAADDVVAAGTDPVTFRPGAAATSQMRSATLVLLGAAGLQPALDSVVAGSTSAAHVSYGDAASYFWLDPGAMRKAVPQIETAMEKADPADGGTFRAGASAFEDTLDSTSVDYESTLSACPRRTIFAPDSAFAPMARAYGLGFVALGTAASPAEVQSGASKVRDAEATAVFAETWVPRASAAAVASAAGVSVKTLDTLTGAPAGGWPRQANYISLLEVNLGTLSSALGCPDQGAGV